MIWFGCAWNWLFIWVILVEILVKIWWNSSYEFVFLSASGNQKPRPKIVDKFVLKSCAKDGVLVAANLLWIIVKTGCWKDWKSDKNRERIWRIYEEHEEHFECDEEHGRTGLRSWKGQGSKIFGVWGLFGNFWKLGWLK